MKYKHFLLFSSGHAAVNEYLAFISCRHPTPKIKKEKANKDKSKIKSESNEFKFIFHQLGLNICDLQLMQPT